MNQLSFKKILVFGLLLGFVCGATEPKARWAGNNLEGLTIRIEAAQMDLSLDLLNSDEQQAQRILSPKSFELFKAHKKSNPDSDWKKKQTLLARSSVVYDNTNMPLPGFTVTAGQPMLMYLARSLMLSASGARGRYGAEEFMSLKYSPELGLRPIVTFHTYSNDGYSHEGFNINYAFQVDCSERIYIDTFMNLEVPFLTPDHALYCKLPDNRGFIAFRIKEPKMQ